MLTDSRSSTLSCTRRGRPLRFNSLKSKSRSFQICKNEKIPQSASSRSLKNQIPVPSSHASEQGNHHSVSIRMSTTSLTSRTGQHARTVWSSEVTQGLSHSKRRWIPSGTTDGIRILPLSQVTYLLGRPVRWQRKLLPRRSMILFLQTKKISSSGEDMFLVDLNTFFCSIRDSSNTYYLDTGSTWRVCCCFGSCCFNCSRSEIICVCVRSLPKVYMPIM